MSDEAEREERGAKSRTRPVVSGQCSSPPSPYRYDCLGPDLALSESLDTVARPLVISILLFIAYLGWVGIGCGV